MSQKLIRTILLAAAIGFFILWIMEYRRAGMFASYWLLLLSIVSLLTFQYNRLKQGNSQKSDTTIKSGKTPPRKNKKV